MRNDSEEGPVFPAPRAGDLALTDKPSRRAGALAVPEPKMAAATEVMSVAVAVSSAAPDEAVAAVPAAAAAPGVIRSARLPLTRVKALVKADPDVSLASQEAIFILARAAVRGWTDE